MTEEQAVDLVLARRASLEIDEAFEPGGAERAIVEYLKKPDAPGVPEDRIAWVVTMLSDTGFVEVHVDDRSGDVLAVRRSA